MATGEGYNSQGPLQRTTSAKASGASNLGETPADTFQLCDRVSSLSLSHAPCQQYGPLGAVCGIRWEDIKNAEHRAWRMSHRVTVASFGIILPQVCQVTRYR